MTQRTFSLSATGTCLALAAVLSGCTTLNDPPPVDMPSTAPPVLIPAAPVAETNPHRATAVNPMGLAVVGLGKNVQPGGYTLPEASGVPSWDSYKSDDCTFDWKAEAAKIATPDLPD